MQFRLDQRSGNELSALGFGCMRFFKDAKQNEKLVAQAVARGINYFDTAYIYPHSEETLGKALAANGLRDRVYIATKLPVSSVRTVDDFDRFFNRQLERLQTTYIDYYLMHMLIDLAQWQRLVAMGIEDWIAAKKSSGAIRQVGFSFHGTKNEFLALLDVYDWDFCQIQYNYSDIHFQAGVEGLKKAAGKGIPVMIMEPLLGGALAGGLPRSAKEIFTKANPALSPAAWALRWLWNHPEVTVVLSSMTNENQLDDNLCAAETALPNCLTPEETAVFNRVGEIFCGYPRIPCTGCGYCLPCAHHVNIPGCFSTYNVSHIMGWFTGVKQYATGAGFMADRQTRASLCTGCRSCESRCPQGIEISRELVRARKRLEPWFVRIILSIARRFTRRKKGRQEIAQEEPTPEKAVSV